MAAKARDADEAPIHCDLSNPAFTARLHVAKRHWNHIDLTKHARDRFTPPVRPARCWTRSSRIRAAAGRDLEPADRLRSRLRRATLRGAGSRAPRTRAGPYVRLSGQVDKALAGVGPRRRGRRYDPVTGDSRGGGTRGGGRDPWGRPHPRQRGVGGVLPGATAGAPRRTLRSDGILPLQQRGSRSQACAGEARSFPACDHRLRRPSWERNRDGVLQRQSGAVLFLLPASLLSLRRHGFGLRQSCRGSTTRGDEGRCLPRGDRGCVDGASCCVRAGDGDLFRRI